MKKTTLGQTIETLLDNILTHKPADAIQQLQNFKNQQKTYGAYEKLYNFSAHIEEQKSRLSSLIKEEQIELFLAECYLDCCMHFKSSDTFKACSRDITSLQQEVECLLEKLNSYKHVKSDRNKIRTKINEQEIQLRSLMKGDEEIGFTRGETKKLMREEIASTPAKPYLSSAQKTYVTSLFVKNEANIIPQGKAQDQLTSPLFSTENSMQTNTDPQRETLFSRKRKATPSNDEIVIQQTSSHPTPLPEPASPIAFHAAQDDIATSVKIAKDDLNQQLLALQATLQQLKEKNKALRSLAETQQQSFQKLTQQALQAATSLVHKHQGRAHALAQEKDMTIEILKTQREKTQQHHQAITEKLRQANACLQAENSMLKNELEKTKQPPIAYTALSPEANASAGIFAPYSNQPPITPLQTVRQPMVAAPPMQTYTLLSPPTIAPQQPTYWLWSPVVPQPSSVRQPPTSSFVNPRP
ncbi:MAG: hypothetical protein K0S08_1751 [Gammaproteobacteria bacterium]|jgi:hypothetical protein|nr:hypothetical protein [Gammaproteobacteria bacterium]